MFNDDDDELDESSYFDSVTEDSSGDSDDSDESSSSSSLSDDLSNTGKTDTSAYNDAQLDPVEVELIQAYDTIANLNVEDDLEPAVMTVLEHIPVHTSKITVNHVLKELFHSQGHSRRQNSVYDSGVMTAQDFLAEDEDEMMNQEFYESYRNLIHRFIEYLANRDLSWDSVTSQRYKRRQLPAFIIFLFSSGSYGYLVNCDTLPKCYKDQVNLAFKKIHETREQIVKDLADAYDKAGRKVIGDKVRELGTSWFNKEPAEIQTTAEMRSLGITSADIDIYREYRSQWNNVSKGITQEFISDYIEVVLDEKKGEYEKLKDKTRAEAINSVKKLFETWSKEQGAEDREMAKKLIFKN